MSLSGPVAATVTSLPYRRTMSMMNRTPSGEAGVLSVRSHAVNERERIGGRIRMAVVHVVAAYEISLRDVSVNAPAESDVDGSAADPNPRCVRSMELRASRVHDEGIGP